MLQQLQENVFKDEERVALLQLVLHIMVPNGHTQLLQMNILGMGQHKTGHEYTLQWGQIAMVVQIQDLGANSLSFVISSIHFRLQQKALVSKST